jgi:hypothetical protein
MEKYIVSTICRTTAKERSRRSADNHHSPSISRAALKKINAAVPYVLEKGVSPAAFVLVHSSTCEAK